MNYTILLYIVARPCCTSEIALHNTVSIVILSLLPSISTGHVIGEDLAVKHDGVLVANL